jgi:D-alanine-D-alanine ligase
MNSRRVAVLLGGWGEEREVSIKTGQAVAQALESRGHQVTRVFAGRGLDQSLRNAEAEVVYNALHGRMGEDGKVQGLLEVMGLPYTGSGVLASALAMNKAVAKKLFRQHNLASPTGYVVERHELLDVEELHMDLGFPCVVKPACGGSSFGLTVVRAREELVPAVTLACRYGGAALVERFVKGKEVTVAVLGDDVLGALEIASPGGTFDTKTKYEGGARYFQPPRLSPTRLANVEAMALAASQALGCRGAVRVDFICSDTANDVVLEVNTQPGMTPQSLLPKIAREAGLSFEDLVEQQLELATLDGAEVLERAPSPVEAERHAG